jgi:hypothetical protein
MLRAHELDWRGPLQGATIVPASVAWASFPLGLSFENLQVVGDRTLVDITAPSSSGTTDYKVRCRFTDSEGLIHETVPPIELRVTPGALVRGGGYTGEVFIGNPVVVVPNAVVKSITMFAPTVTTPKSPASIAQSVQFKDASAAVLTKTFAGAALDATKATVSVWFRRNAGRTLTRQGMTFLFGGADAANNTALYFETGDIFAFGEGKIRFEHLDAGASVGGKRATFQNRDNGAWYHLVLALDSNEAVEADRIKFWLNGRAVTDTNILTVVPLGKTFDWLGTDPNSIGQGQTDNHNPHQMDANVAELHIVDGFARTADDFGLFDADGFWGPASYVDSHGTNGGYFDFADSSNFGNDVAGANDWSSAGLVAADQIFDTPDDVYPVLERNSGATEILGGGTIHDATDGGRHNALATVGLTAGKWYWEVEFDIEPARILAGMYEYSFGQPEVGPLGTSLNPNMLGGYCIISSGVFYSNRDGGIASGLSPFVAGDICQFCYDAANGKLWVGRNNTFIGNPAAGTGQIATVLSANGTQRAATPWSQVTATSAGATTGQAIYNFGAKGLSDLVFTPPSGFLRISTGSMGDTDYAPIPNGNVGNASVLYTGNGSAQSLGGFAFTPDLGWVKKRGAAGNHVLVDSARGDFEQVSTNLVAAESTNLDGLELEAAGFRVGTDADVNAIGDTYVGWMFKKGPAFGVDIVEYTGNGVAGRTIAHALGGRPDLVMVKNLDQALDWQMLWMHWLDDVIIDARTMWVPKANPEQYAAPMAGGTWVQSPVYWNDTAPTQSVVTLGSSSSVNASGERFIAYLFRSIPGYCRVNAYKTISPWCGFRPRFILQRRMSTGTGNTDIMDSSLISIPNADTMDFVNQAGGFGAIRSRSFLANTNALEAADDMNVSARNWSQGGSGGSFGFSFLALAEFPTIKSRGY